MSILFWSILKSGTELFLFFMLLTPDPHVSVCCNVLQCVEMCCGVLQCVAVYGSLLCIRSCTQTFFLPQEIAVFPHYYSQTLYDTCMLHFLSFLWVLGKSSTLFKSLCFLVVLCIKPFPFVGDEIHTYAPPLQYSRWECNEVRRCAHVYECNTFLITRTHSCLLYPNFPFPPENLLASTLAPHSSLLVFLQSCSLAFSRSRKYLNVHIYIYI